VTAIEHFAAALLEGVVEDLKFFPPAIPLEAFDNPYLRFRGDNLFGGKTVREKLPVFVKCFWGRNEIRHYENELEMLRTVWGCPYVQDLIHHGIDHRRPFAVLVTRYAGDTWTPGGMDKVLMNDLRSIGRQVLQALVSLHKKGIIHRDVKPGNICVSANRRATLIDFGLSIRGRRRPYQRTPCNDERPIDHPDHDSPPCLTASEDSDNSSRTRSSVLHPNARMMKMNTLPQVVWVQKATWPQKLYLTNAFTVARWMSMGWASHWKNGLFEYLIPMTKQLWHN
jgi:serine/threonine protein kinase